MEQALARRRRHAWCDHRIAAPRARRRRRTPSGRSGRDGAHEQERLTHWRSCAKPFQVMPLHRRPGASIASAGATTSSRSRARRTAASRSMSPSPRGCSRPSAWRRATSRAARTTRSPRAARRLLREKGAHPTRLHNNCSGKHAAMLAHAHSSGWPTFGYERQDHPVQRDCLAEVAKWTGVAASDIVQAVDGCGVRGVRAAARRHGSRVRAPGRRGAPLRRHPVAYRARDADAPLSRRRHRPLRFRAHRGDRRTRHLEDRRGGRPLRRRHRRWTSGSRSRSRTARSARSFRPCCAVLQHLGVLPRGAAAATRGVPRSVRCATPRRDRRRGAPCGLDARVDALTLPRVALVRLAAGDRRRHARRRCAQPCAAAVAGATRAHGHGWRSCSCRATCSAAFRAR